MKTGQLNKSLCIIAVTVNKFYFYRFIYLTNLLLIYVFIVSFYYNKVYTRRINLTLLTLWIIKYKQGFEYKYFDFFFDLIFNAAECNYVRT